MIIGTTDIFICDKEVCAIYRLLVKLNDWFIWR